MADTWNEGHNLARHKGFVPLQTAPLQQSVTACLYPFIFLSPAQSFHYQGVWVYIKISINNLLSTKAKDFWQQFVQRSS